MFLLVSLVIFGGIKRIAKVASKLVPSMVGFYLIAAIIIIIKNFSSIPSVIGGMIFQDAFSGDAVAGGAIGSMIIIGVRRGLFSNEAGTGTETMAHGAAKTTEPIREGLVAMLGPFIDTIIVCSITAVVILTSGVYMEDLNGVSMTASAFDKELGIFGQIFFNYCSIDIFFNYVWILLLWKKVYFSFIGDKMEILLQLVLCNDNCGFNSIS